MRTYLTVFTFGLIALKSGISESIGKELLEFGQPLGQNSSVIAYSNAHEAVISHQFNETGMKWQCVEYARRWLSSVKKTSFPSVDYAFEIWDLEEGFALDTGKEVPVQRFENGKSRIPPKNGDLIIYNTEFTPITGHVAVVVDIQDKEVMLAEQNYSAKSWDGRTYSRRLTLSSNDGYFLHDAPGLIGWLRF